MPYVLPDSIIYFENLDDSIAFFSRSLFLIIISSNKLADKGINKYSDIVLFSIAKYIPSPYHTSQLAVHTSQLQTELFREGDTTDINNYRNFALHISDFLKIKIKNIPIFDFSSPVSCMISPNFSRRGRRLNLGDSKCTFAL